MKLKIKVLFLLSLPEPVPVSSSRLPTVLDVTDCPIPVDLLGLWNRREEVKDWMAMLSEVKCAIEKAKADGDLLYVEIRDSLIADLKMAREAVSYALPFAVCPTCNGKLARKAVCSVAVAASSASSST